MKMTNGNVPKLIKVGHNNIGSGVVSRKISEIDYIMYNHQPSILGISETVMDPEAINILTTEGLQVETKSDNERISVIIAGNVNYRRRRDLETDFQPVIWFL